MLLIKKYNILKEQKLSSNTTFKKLNFTKEIKNFQIFYVYFCFYSSKLKFLEKTNYLWVMLPD